MSALGTDRQGLPTTGTSEGLAQFDAAVDSLLHFRLDLLDAVDLAVATDPTMPMARVFAAYLGVLGTEADDAAAASRAFSVWVSGADLTRAHDRERAHVAIAHRWLGGDMLGAGEMLGQLTGTYPRDILALAVGHQIDFFSGAAGMLRDRVGGALTAWDPDDDHYSLVLGMYAFGLEEAGHYDRSEAVGHEAVALDPKDVWGIHAVVHTYEMQGRFSHGLRFLDERVADFDQGNFLRVHNWWHYCLDTLEAGRPDLALRVFDAVLHPEGSAGLSLHLLDATSLLWRLYLEGDRQLARFETLADAWVPRVSVPHYAFNDMHAVMAFVGAGRLHEAQQLVADRQRYLEAPSGQGSNVLFTGRVGLPVCRAVLAFDQGRYREVLDLLAPIRHRLQQFGGSHAQRDIVQRTLLEAALRDRSLGLARQLLSERLGVNPASPYNWIKQAVLRRFEGRGEEAAAAVERAESLVGAAAPDFAAEAVLLG